MVKFIVVNSIAAVVIIALSLGLVFLLASMVPEAKAEILQAPLLQSDVVEAKPACLLQGWPNYAPHCQFVLRAGSGETRIVRIIALR
jgi:hypothetical protein